MHCEGRGVSSGGKKSHQRRENQFLLYEAPDEKSGYSGFLWRRDCIWTLQVP